MLTHVIERVWDLSITFRFTFEVMIIEGLRARKMAQNLRTLLTFPEGEGLVSSTYKVAQNISNSCVKGYYVLITPPHTQASFFFESNFFYFD